MYENDTELPNGVIVSVPIKYGDYSEFFNKCKEQLAYFDSVYFDIPGFNNDFKIYREKDFQWSELCSNGYMHISMDNVYYPIDWAKLGVSGINIPVALRFSLTDGLIPIPNREQLEYTNTTKKIILDKIKVVADWMVEKWNSENDDKDSVLDVWNALNSSYKSISFHNDKNELLKTFDITSILRYGNVIPKSPSVKGISHIDLLKVRLMRDNLLRGWRYAGEVKVSGYAKKWCNKVEHWNSSDQHDILTKLVANNSAPIFIAEDKVGNVLKDFVKDTIGKCYIITESAYEFTLAYYKKVLGLSSVKKSEWRTHINEFRTIQQQFLKNVKYLKDIKPTADWLQERKNKIVRSAASRTDLGEIHPKYAEPSARWGGSYASFKQNGRKAIKDLYKHPSLVVYGTEEEKDRLSELFRLIENTEVCILGKKDYEKMEKLSVHNFIKIETFMEGRYKEFGRTCTSYKIQEVFNKNNDLLGNIPYLRKLQSEFAEDLEKLIKYKKGYTFYNTALMTEMLEICDKNKLWDLEILAILHRVEKWMGVFSFITNFKVESRYSSVVSEETLPLAKEILRARKVRMNLLNYKLVNVVTNDGLTVETDAEPTVDVEVEENELVTI